MTAGDGTATSSPAPAAAPDGVAPEWRDEPSKQLDGRAADLMFARVAPNKRQPTEVVLFGRCPRCRHQTRWTHRLIAVVRGEQQPAALAAQGLAEDTDEIGERVTAQCRCGYAHTNHPEGELSCGAPFSVVVSWTTNADGIDAKVRESQRTTNEFDLEEARELEASTHTELADTRKAAENWRTGLAGLLAVLTGFLTIKGKDSIDDIDPGFWRFALAALLLLAAMAAIFGAYRAIRAAYGIPRNELLRKNLADYGTVSAWRHSFAQIAVDDLRLAKIATVASLTLLAVAFVVTWSAPGKPPPAFVKATFTLSKDKTKEVCGELIRADTDKVLIKVKDGDVRPFKLSQLSGLSVVGDCG